MFGAGEHSIMEKELKKAALLGISLIGLAAITNQIIDIKAAKEECIPKSKGKYFKWKYGDIYYIKKGKGKPVLLIHDLNPCSSTAEWSKIIKVLSENNTVYALDLLGCGQSDKPNITYTNYLYVQLINDFIKKVIGSRTNAVVTGESFSFTVMACQMESKNFNKIIGVSPCDIYNQIKTPNKKRNICKHILESPIIGTFLYNIDTSKVRIRSKTKNINNNRKESVTEKFINSYYKASKIDHSRGKYLQASIRSCYTKINIIPAIEKINNSICLIGGRTQPFIHDIIDEYKAHNSAIEEAYISNAGYLPQVENPEKFVKLINIII